MLPSLAAPVATRGAWSPCTLCVLRHPRTPAGLAFCAQASLGYIISRQNRSIEPEAEVGSKLQSDSTSVCMMTRARIEAELRRSVIAPENRKHNAEAHDELQLEDENS